MTNPFLELSNLGHDPSFLEMKEKQVVDYKLEHVYMWQWNILINR